MSIRTVQSSALAPRHTAVAARNNIGSITPWVRNPSWLALPTVGNTEQKFVGLHAVWPDSNFLALSAAGAYTVNWGDGVTQNFASGATAQRQYDFTDVDIANTNAPVTFQDTGDTVTRTAHGYTDGMTVSFSSITTTTGIVAGQIYYVVNATANTFQVSATSGGAALALTTDGSGIILPYKQVIVTVTPQAGQNLTSLNLSIKNTTVGLQTYSSGWLDILISGPNLTTLIVGSAAISARHYYLEQAQLISTNSIASMNNMFFNCRELKSIPIWTTSNTLLTNINGMFSGCHSLQTVPLFNTAAVTGMTETFLNCYSLQSVPPFNMAACQFMANTFQNCVSLKTIPLFNTPALINTTNTFNGCHSLQSVPLFNTALVTNMNRMFQNCSSLQTVPLFNTTAVTNMSEMFAECWSLETVPLFNTAAVTNMNSMFLNCFSLQTVPLFNTAAVTIIYFMFTGCRSLKTVPLFNTGAATDMAQMFQNCFSLESVPLFNTAAVTNMRSMFQNCYSLATVPLFNTAIVTSMQTMFSNCFSLQTVPLFNTAAVTNMNSMFVSCNSLQSVPALTTTAVTSSANFSSMFTGCESLTRIEAKDFRFTFVVAGCKLSATALNEIYTNLPIAVAQTITVSNNWGTAADNPAIATAKGWTVSG